jgi:putative GTP pyrophosphokinase
VDVLPSKSQVDKAGAFLRTWWSEEQEPADAATEARLVQAVSVVWTYRASFQYPLAKTTANLRYYVKQRSPRILVAQRLKRTPRIVEKLTRLPKMRLSQMQDIAGCRAILPDGEAVLHVLAGIERNWDVVHVVDYVTVPKETGYRGMHAIIKKDSVFIEVQLRTPGQQGWADLVERLDGRHGLGLKDGQGPAELLEWFRIVGEAVALEEAGESPDGEIVQRLHELAPSVEGWLTTA